MRDRIRAKATYANVMSTIAVFGVLAGGGAYAASAIGPADIATNAVRGRHIQAQQVANRDIKPRTIRSARLDEGAVNSTKIADGSILGDDIASSALNFLHVDSRALFVAGVASAQVRDIGSGGDVRYGSPFGVSTASADIDDVITGSPAETFSVSMLDVQLDDPLPAGTSRTFALMRSTVPLGFNVECTIGPGEQRCQNTTDVGQTNLNGDVAIQIESTGAGLSAGDDARVGFAMTTHAPFSDP